MPPRFLSLNCDTRRSFGTGEELGLVRDGLKRMVGSVMAQARGRFAIGCLLGRA